MSKKMRLAAFVTFALALICLSACRAAVQAGFTPDTEVQSTLDIAPTKDDHENGDHSVKTNMSIGLIRSSAALCLSRGNMLLDGYEA